MYSHILAFYLDNILLKCANESNATECHPSLLRQSSLESLRCADNPNDLNKCKMGVIRVATYYAYQVVVSKVFENVATYICS